MISSLNNLNNNNKNVLLITRGVLSLEKNLYGGAEIYVLRIAEQLNARGFQVGIIADCSSEILELLNKKGITIYNIGFPHFLRDLCRKLGFWGWLILHFVGNILATIKALRVIKSFEYNIVHCHANLACLLLSYFNRRVKLIYTLHDSGPWLSYYDGFIKRIIRKLVFYNFDVRAVKRSEVTTVVFQLLKEHLIKEFSIPIKKIKVISSGVDLLHFSASKIDKREYFIFIGQLTWRKGLDVLLTLAEKIEFFKLKIIGDGELAEWLLSEIDNRKLGSKVEFIGAVSRDKIVDYFHKAKALVLPSRADAMPLVVLESLSCSVPVIATNVGGIPELVKHRYTGFIYEVDDLIGFENAIRIIENDTKFALELGANGRKFVENTFSWEVISTLFENIYFDNDVITNQN